MGINLTDIIPRKEIDFKDLKGKIIAIDAFNALYQFLSSIRGYDGSPLKDNNGKITSHLQGLFSRTLNLMGKGIKPIYVFDGEPPELKFKEIRQRSERKIEAKQKYNDAIDEENIDDMYKYSKQFVRLDYEMIEDSKKLISAMGLPVVQAKSEAEGQTAFMCKQKDVDYSASQDYDSLLFGAPKLLRNLTLSQKRKTSSGKIVYTFIEEITLKDVLKELDITQEQLIVLGILVGTDFNQGGIKGIGPKKALKLVKEHKTEKDFERMFEELNAPFEWKKIYKIFNDLPVEKKYKIEWKELDEEKIKEILVKEHDFSEERIQNSIEKYKELNKERNQKGLSEFI